MRRKAQLGKEEKGDKYTEKKRGGGGGGGTGANRVDDDGVATPKEVDNVPANGRGNHGTKKHQAHNQLLGGVETGVSLWRIV